MTKFEEELKDREAETFSHWDGCTISKKEFINYADVVNLSQGWVSPEEYEKLVKNCAVYVLECKNINRVNAQLTKENENLKSQLQQQALPVVPECVAEYIERCKRSDCGLIWAIRPDRDANDNSEKVYDWLFPNGVKLPNGMYPNPYEPDNLVRPDKENQIKFVRAWLDGYQVEKPQLFYLREKNTGYYLRKSGTDWYGITSHYSNDSDENYMNYKFTQQEIDSMQTGSYELVPVEDGE